MTAIPFMITLGSIVLLGIQTHVKGDRHQLMKLLDVNCPSPCTCTGRQVNCSSSGLTNIPQGNFVIKEIIMSYNILNHVSMPKIIFNILSRVFHFLNLKIIIKKI